MYLVRKWLGFARHVFTNKGCQKGNMLYQGAEAVPDANHSLNVDHVFAAKPQFLANGRNLVRYMGTLGIVLFFPYGIVNFLFCQYCTNATCQKVKYVKFFSC